METVPFFKGDSNELTQEGQALMKLAGKYGATTNVIPSPLKERSPGLLGFMSFEDPKNVRIDPTQAGLFTAAHELIHSSFPTKIGLDDMNLRMQPEVAAQKFLQANLNKASGPAQLRYLYETQSVPKMLEEASAQGGARGLTEQMGYGNIDSGQPTPGVFNVYRTPKGDVDSLAYPLYYRDTGINSFMASRGVGFGFEADQEGRITRDGLGMFEGSPLGIGIDPRFTPAEREEYYRIVENARPRAERMFNSVYNRFSK